VSCRARFPGPGESSSPAHPKMLGGDLLPMFRAFLQSFLRTVPVAGQISFRDETFHLPSTLQFADPIRVEARCTSLLPSSAFTTRVADS
jgi:hypothetical protein